MHRIEKHASPLREEGPRYEFRIWSRDFGHLFNRFRSLGPLEEVEGCTDRYIVSKDISTFSTKLRGDTLDVKQLIERRRPLERWRSYVKLGFPLDRRILRAKVAPVLALEPERLVPDRYSAEAFLQAAVIPDPRLECVTVEKMRFLFSVDGCRAEYTVAAIDGAMRDTVALEGREVAPVLEIIALLGLRGHENLDYQRAIRMFAKAPIDFPGPGFHGAADSGLRKE